MVKAGTNPVSSAVTEVDGYWFTFIATTGGHNIWHNGQVVGWSAGNLADARNTARDIVRAWSKVGRA